MKLLLGVLRSLFPPSGSHLLLVALMPRQPPGWWDLVLHVGPGRASSWHQGDTLAAGKLGVMLGDILFCPFLALPGEREMTPGSSQEGGVDQRPLMYGCDCLLSHRRDCGDHLPFHRRVCSQLVPGHRSCGSAHTDLKTSPISRFHPVIIEAANVAMCSLP